MSASLSRNQQLAELFQQVEPPAWFGPWHSILIVVECATLALLSSVSVGFALHAIGADESIFSACEFAFFLVFIVLIVLSQTPNFKLKFPLERVARWCWLREVGRINALSGQHHTHWSGALGVGDSELIKQPWKTRWMAYHPVLAVRVLRGGNLAARSGEEACALDKATKAASFTHTPTRL